MILQIPSSIRQKSDDFLIDYGVTLKKDVEVNLQTCLEMKQLTHVLKQLRHLSDDTLDTNLNNSSLPEVQYRLKQCNNVVLNDLFPAWYTRDRILGECKSQLEGYKTHLDENKPTELVNSYVPETEAERNLDPYAKRDLIKKNTLSYADYNSASKWLEQQNGVEKIIKERSIGVLKNNCNENVKYMTEFELFCKKNF